MTMMMALMALQAPLSAAGVPPGTARLPIVPAVPPAVSAVPSVRAGLPGAAPATVAPSATPHPDRAQVRAAVDAEWRRYDLRGAGRLGPLEFATWVMRANGATVALAGVRNAPGMKPVSAMNATARAFARADANHDGGVTPEEMTDFLMR